MALTAVPNTPAIVLQPTGPGSTIALNPFYSQCDPTNGNYFTTTNRDLVTFYLYPAAQFAPVWLSTTTYTAGQVVSVTSGSPSVTTFYIAQAYSISGVPQTNLNQPPATSPNFWQVYVDGDANVTLYSAPDACTGRKANVNDYNVPLGAGSVEFLVLPSSVFTQANGQFQFLASSNLIYVYVRNL